MLWPREEFHAAYGQMKHDALQSGGSCSVLILVALDVDALCAAEILTRLLRADMLSYSLLAVRGYEDVLQARETRIRGADGTLRGGGELRSVVLLNCGAIVDVAKLLALPTHVKCYVLDSHRPIHLANIYDEHQQVVVFDDGALALEEYPAFGPDLEVEDFEEEEEEEDDDEEEEDAQEEESDGEAEVEFGTQDTETSETEKRKREDEKDGEEEETEQSPKRRKEEDADTDAGADAETEADAVAADDPVEESAVMAKRRRREEILRYYRGSFHGAPAATVAFELAQQVNSAQRDLLWFAIIGLTKQFVLEEIDADNYNLMVTRFQDEVLAVDAPTSSSGPGANDDEDRHPGYDDGKISFEEEYRFMCYRHWSLYEAMYYSDYVSSKLGLYHDQARRVGARNASGNSGTGAGDTALHVFLARMGFSLRQSQQKFSYMPLEMKQMLREKTQEMAPEFGLDDLFYGSFKRTFAFQYQLGAADAVYGLQALLEAPESYVAAIFEAETQHQQQNALTSLFALDSILSSSANDSNAAGQSDKDGKDKDDEAAEESPQDDFRQQNFMLAHTALACQSVTSSKLMESGVKVAMSLKQAIVRVGLSIMERKLLVRVKHFRYVCLNVPEREQELFANANVLTQLALFLLNVHRASGKWGGPNAPARRKPQGEDGENGEDGDAEEEAPMTNKSIVPLVLITRNPAQNCFLVVGLTCPSTPGEIHRNTLGTAFKLAAGETGANFRQDGFTSAVMEIQIDEIQYFVEQLHNVLDA
ncbi:DNA replication initiation factor cdc45 [Phytophthora pseudosyringae]|uniref:DNA replication initiation factor cdc45 n=1 Tax=Phytophthora pseudosyringae TaxID=221518 RepID=A0A8T1WF84_9STRA|nr:DNA replication initiation factor cdc45 [Phytophthora pseudosyringae]